MLQIALWLHHSTTLYLSIYLYTHKHTFACLCLSNGIRIYIYILHSTFFHHILIIIIFFIIIIIVIYFVLFENVRVCCIALHCIRCSRLTFGCYWKRHAHRLWSLASMQRMIGRLGNIEKHRVSLVIEPRAVFLFPSTCRKLYKYK